MNSAPTAELMDMGQPQRSLASGLWQTSQKMTPPQASGRRWPPQIREYAPFVTSTTAIVDPWPIELSHHEAAATVPTAANELLVHSLGWTREQALETRQRLRAFEEDWDAPGMELYDDL